MVVAVSAAALLLPTVWSGAASATPNYQQQLKQLETVSPAQYEGPTTAAKAPKDLKVAAVISDEALEGDEDEAYGIQQAAQSIGATYRAFDGQGSTTTQNAQIANAVTWGANVIILVAVLQSTVASGLADAKNANVPVIGTNGTKNGDVSTINSIMGRYQGGAIIYASGGKANALIMGDKEFVGTAVPEEDAVKLFKSCSGCTTGPIMWFTFADVSANLGPTVVSYVRTHPSVKWILVPFDPAVPAIVTALQGAGLTNQVKIVSGLGNHQNLEYVKNGTVQVADYAFDNQYLGWAALDQGIRAVDHLKPAAPYNENVPEELLTKSNLGDISNYTHGWYAPYQKQYEAKFDSLWK